MKNFLAIYLGGAATGRPDDATIARGMAAWHKWMDDHAADVVVQGGPLGKTKKVGPGGVSDSRNLMTGFIVVKTESHEAAAKMFESHPHFSIFPGDSIEVMESLPIPGMS